MANISTQLSDLAIIRSLLLQRIANNLSAEVAGAYQNIIDDISRDIRGATPKRCYTNHAKEHERHYQRAKRTL